MTEQPNIFNNHPYIIVNSYYNKREIHTLILSCVVLGKAFTYIQHFYTSTGTSNPHHLAFPQVRFPCQVGHTEAETLPKGIAIKRLKWEATSRDTVYSDTTYVVYGAKECLYFLHRISQQRSNWFSNEHKQFLNNLRLTSDRRLKYFIEIFDTYESLRASAFLGGGYWQGTKDSDSGFVLSSIVRQYDVICDCENQLQVINTNVK